MLEILVSTPGKVYPKGNMYRISLVTQEGGTSVVPDSYFLVEYVKEEIDGEPQEHYVAVGRNDNGKRIIGIRHGHEKAYEILFKHMRKFAQDLWYKEWRLAVHQYGGLSRQVNDQTGENLFENWEPPILMPDD